MTSIITRFTHSSIDLIALRISAIIIFVLFGTYKWFDFEVQALEPLLSNTWLNILYIFFGVYGGSYFLGVVETFIFLALIAGFYKPAWGAIGAIMVIVTGVTTLSLLPQLGKVDGFIVKDILLIGIGLTLLKQDLIRCQQSRADSTKQ